jgi:hypothetical protein
MVKHEVPDGLPVLSRGKHRSPRKGACFMEMASVLADEPWSDHPRCTHPLLAHLARLVNDYTSDQNRGELAVLVPSVVGLHGGGLAWTVDLTAAVALNAILDVPEASQRALAAGLIRCDELAASLRPGAVESAGAVHQALDRVPGAVAWARQFVDGSVLSPEQFLKRSAPSVMLCAVRGLANSATTDPDARLRGLLEVGIATAQRHEPSRAPAVTERSIDLRPLSGTSRR